MLMKKILYILVIILVLISLSSCSWEHREENYTTLNNQSGLKELLTSFDLWYVDIDRTTGTGNIPFISRAFTISFMPDQNIFANNNMVGIGSTGNGFGINIGVYDTYENILQINDDVFGYADFKVSRISDNVITLYNNNQNVIYYLEGYQKYQFNYDKLFYENVVYFLQEYQVWTKYFDDIVSPNTPFVYENHLAFYVNGNQNVFESSESSVNVNLSNIYWDYTGLYQVFDTYTEIRKELLLQYNFNNSTESFILTVLDDNHIQLHNTQSGNIYRFYGREFIQYKPQRKRIILKKRKSNNRFKKQ
jgi:hypothetical protein